MQPINICDIFRQVKDNNSNDLTTKQISVGGWLKSKRDGKSFGFLVLADGTCFHPLQIVYDDKLPNFAVIAKLQVGSALIVCGQLILTPEAAQPFELHATTIAIEGESATDYPLQKKRHTFEYLRTISHLRPRANTFQAVFRIRSLASFAIHQFFRERDFLYVHTPIITASDCEGAGEMFHVTSLDLATIPLTTDGQPDFAEDFFGKPASLTVSGQLNGEMFAMAFKNIYTFGPTFRAENSHTARHAAEFWMIEPEMAFADLGDIMILAEDMLKYVIRYIFDHAVAEMAFLNEHIDKELISRLTHVVNSTFVHLTYTEAIAILKEQNEHFEYQVTWGCDLQTEHERYLTEQKFNCPVFVTDYPAQIKAFYMKMNEDNETVAAMDLLAPAIGEIIGGSQREDDYDKLRTRMITLGMNSDDYTAYLDLRRFGSTRHAGFGLGFERLLMYLTGMGNIRDVLPFPRTVRNCEL
ncbi:MAG: asparagine--tRNA ligase [Lachnospiraceae bacterium]|jgi:asparaginyl-tRNA synthetase|nr:asparagine--tRNA ligase [Lachnospiraceae bacterium]